MLLICWIIYLISINKLPLLFSSLFLLFALPSVQDYQRPWPCEPNTCGTCTYLKLMRAHTSRFDTVEDGALTASGPNADGPTSAENPRF